jgi:SHS2 domain-containing protein
VAATDGDASGAASPGLSRAAPTVGAGFEITEHTADLGLRVWASSQPVLFEQAALALSSLLCDPATVEPRETFTVVAEAPAGSPDALLVAWLNELLYRVETDGIVLSRFTVEGLTRRYVSARAQGEPIDQRRHQPRFTVKAATYHDLSVRQHEGRWEATVLLDV